MFFYDWRVFLGFLSFVIVVCCLVSKLCLTLLLHGLQHARLLCPSLSPRVFSNSCPLSRRCHPTISSSAALFFCPQSFPASVSFPVCRLFASGGQRIGVSTSALVLAMNIQDWSPLEWTGWISLQSKGLSRVFSNTTVQKHQFFRAQLSLWSNSHIHTRLLDTFLGVRIQSQRVWRVWQSSRVDRNTESGMRPPEYKFSPAYYRLCDLNALLTAPRSSGGWGYDPVCGVHGTELASRQIVIIFLFLVFLNLKLLILIVMSPYHKIIPSYNVTEMQKTDQERKVRGGAEGEEGNRGWDGWMASSTQWWVWANSRRWWRTGKPGALQSMGSQIVRHDSETQQQTAITKERHSKEALSL